MQETSTRSPAAIVVTAAPTSTTVPTASWPRIVPGFTSGTSPLRMCRSVPQIVDVSIRTIASVGCRSSGRARSPRPVGPGRGRREPSSRLLPWFPRASPAAAGRPSVRPPIAHRSSPRRLNWARRHARGLRAFAQASMARLRIVCRWYRRPQNHVDGCGQVPMPAAGSRIRLGRSRRCAMTALAIIIGISWSPPSSASRLRSSGPTRNPSHRVPPTVDGGWRAFP